MRPVTYVQCVACGDVDEGPWGEVVVAIGRLPVSVYVCESCWERHFGHEAASGDVL